MADRPLRELVAEKLLDQSANLTRLEGCPLKGVETRRLRFLRRFGAGRTSPLEALPDVDQLLLREFLELGAKAILSTGAQRAGDFLNNQLRGRWAEDVVVSMDLPDLRFIPFGPSGAAMPGQEDHRRIITTFREIELIEGKRPDLLLFDRATWAALTEAERDRARTWPERLLEAEDLALARQSRCGVEVKNSTWHYAKRREHRATLDDEDGGPLSITVKDEELRKIVGWMESTNRPLLFFQVLFDEIYCMSFSRMVDGITLGRVYTEGDYLRDTQTGAGGKVYHRFFLRDTRHRCAFVAFPDQSEARVEVLVSGSVIPYVQLLPAQAHGGIQQVITSELAVAEQALAIGLPVIP